MKEFMKTANVREQYHPENRYEYLNVTDLYQLDTTIVRSEKPKKEVLKGTSGWPQGEMTYQVLPKNLLSNSSMNLGLLTIPDIQSLKTRANSTAVNPKAYQDLSQSSKDHPLLRKMSQGSKKSILVKYGSNNYRGRRSLKSLRSNKSEPSFCKMLSEPSRDFAPYPGDDISGPSIFNNNNERVLLRATHQRLKSGIIQNTPDIIHKVSEEPTRVNSAMSQNSKKIVLSVLHSIEN